MPVADESQDQDQRRDHQQASRFQSIDLRSAVVLGRMGIRLSFCTRRRHISIVAPERRRSSKRLNRPGRLQWNPGDQACVSSSNAGARVCPLGLRRKSMKRFALVALGVCLAVAPIARADEWSKTYTITGKPDLRVETSDADIHVDTWDQNTIEARVTSDRYKIGGGRGLKIEEHQSGDSVDLQVRLPHESHIINFNFHNQVEVEIHMPREGRVSLHT